MSGQHQSTATLTHKDGAIMAYDILGIQHLDTDRTPIVLVGGLSSLRGDWERLANALSEVRPVLLLDHRGMGGSTFSPRGGEQITIELYARDILDLLNHLQWKRIALCGFSMGGAVVQQILLLPHHTRNPTAPHPFTITHVFLTGTFTSTPAESSLWKNLQSIPPPPANGKRWTKEEKKEIARTSLELTFDDTWLNDPDNRERFDLLLERMIVGRPMKTILQQGLAVRNLNFHAPRSLISPNIPILVIHGENDRIVSFSSSREVLSLIPHAKFVSVGPNRGQLPNLKFGHQWYEYFDAQVWVDVFEGFMEAESMFRTKL